MRTNAARPRLAAKHLLLSLVAITLTGLDTGNALAQDLSPMPAHAHTKRYGGWECERGYARIGQSCVEIDVPANAFLDSSEHRWECARGYRRAGETCVAVEVPPNAHLRSTGDSWECNRGYRKSGASCEGLAVPANAHLTSWGNDGSCDPGCERSGDVCTRRAQR